MKQLQSCGKKGEVEKRKEEEEEEELIAEDRIKQKKESEERSKAADFVVAKDLFGDIDRIKNLPTNEKEKNDIILLELDPKDDYEFQELARAIAKRVEKYTTDFHYRNFVKELTKMCCESLTTDDMNDIVTALNVIVNAKLKAQKGGKGKGKKTQAKKKLNVAKKDDDEFENGGEDELHGDYEDDFM